ncbi:hypothetical protein [Clostridium sporogenes]|uniref:hypothetical protein n=1 Tax=Clostridium sporogenes TaxID=1509 RepID=UPI0013D0704E|nr:hypothetical protein [Clostridium sporogenes]NFH40869.1 hypothetical protein [Clostridium sporogenes]
MVNIEFKKFNPLNISSKFAICGLPLRVDTYKTCSFNCKYCFSNYREIMKFKKELQIANLSILERKLKKIKEEHKIKENNFLDTLISEDITWHCGGMSDPFQPIEKELHITKQMIDITNRYDIHILFSTKTDNLYKCNVNPKLHTFQFSVTNLENKKDIEPNVPDINKRIKLYKDLKKDGFKVGIRIQPFIPNVTKDTIVDEFKDADYFTIEGLKLVPQNKEQKEYLLKLLNLNKEDFTQMGLLNLKPEIRLQMYKNFINKLKSYNIPFSIADNDMHYISSGKCCCGDPLIHKSTSFNNTSLIQKYGTNYSLENVLKEVDSCGGCKSNQLFTSNRQEGCISVNDFFIKRFNRKTSPFSPKFLYCNKIHNSIKIDTNEK